MWHWPQSSHTDQWNRIESRNKLLHLWSFVVRRPRQFNGERIVFSTNSARPTVYPDIKERSCSSISQQTKSNSIWIKDLTFVRYHSEKLLEESI